MASMYHRIITITTTRITTMAMIMTAAARMLMSNENHMQPALGL